MKKEHIYFMVLTTDGHRYFMSTTLPLWKALHLYYYEEKIHMIKLMNRDEYYEQVGN